MWKHFPSDSALGSSLGSVKDQRYCVQPEGLVIPERSLGAAAFVNNGFEVEFSS